ncbi:MAG: DNA-directed RNA polymerase subunit beta' [Pseudomonadota bacterium]
MESRRPIPLYSRKADQSVDVIARLAEPARIECVGPIAVRFIYSLRLIAVHEHARLDPVAELSVRLGSVTAASASLGLASAIARFWPEDIQISRFCCRAMTHDEATIAAMVEHACDRRRREFENLLAGLIRPARVVKLWDHAIELVVAESHG